MTDPVPTRLLRLLEAERTAILSGNFAELGSFEEEKADLINLLDSARPDAETHALLTNLAQRNLKLADAERRGIRGVAERLRAVGQVQKSFETYTRDGARVSVSSAGPGFEKRA